MMPKVSSPYRVKGSVRGSSRPSMYSDLYPSRRRKTFPRALVVGVVVVAVIVGVGGLISSPATPPDAPTSEVDGTEDVTFDESIPLVESLDAEPLVVGEGMMTASGEGRLSFCAVGDNVLNEQLLTSADAAMGSLGDGRYDFMPLYAPVASTIANEYDVAFINQETVLGGDEGFVFSGYPTFNSPDEVAEALVDSGWDVINCNSNHTYDIGADGIRHEIELWQAYPDVLTIGMFPDTDEAQRVRMIERNGIRIAFLSYNYGLNGYESAGEGAFAHYETGATFYDDGSLVNLISETKLARDIPKAKEQADAVVVSMHFGDEYVHEPNDYQRQWAQRCADLGADVVLGTHTHFIQPIEWIQSESGDDCLVAWCLGDFASGYGRIDASLGGMLSCDFLRSDSGDVTVDNVRWTPTIEHLENGQYSVYFLKDYTDELAAKNEQYTLAASPHNTQEMVSDIRAYARQLNESVMGNALTIDA